jgi:hypothetical protein
MQKKLYFISILIGISFLQPLVAVTKVTSTSSLQKSTILGIAHLLTMKHYPQAGYVAIRESGRNFQDIEVEFVPMAQEDAFKPIPALLQHLV